MVAKVLAVFFFLKFLVLHGIAITTNTKSARDADGHGTHTASTVAGSQLLDLPSTRLVGLVSAMMPIFSWPWMMQFTMVLTLFLLVGPLPPQTSYLQDAIPIGTFHTFQKGILVSASAGNSFFPGTTSNVVPWILNVAASTIDYEFQSYIYLGNSKMLKDFGLTQPNMKGYYSLIAESVAVAPGVPQKNASFCKNNTLAPTLIKREIVVCEIESNSDSQTEKETFVREGGVVGIILIDPLLLKDVSFQFVIPSTLIGQEQAEEFKAYVAAEK
ncbi:subtilisin-like serine-protease S [Diospyros lotus]|uniref:subtilisin-like serine-protease S n=1 Tax=Diospyros lotus TaxID=55363 RepID=UPI002250FEAB|nr:subtilisin-like serine-protease S [Diospyros lotus]